MHIPGVLCAGGAVVLDEQIICIYINSMGEELIWDEHKRQINLLKHGLDFADAHEVLDSRYRMDVVVVRQQEKRTLSMSYVMGCLAVLTAVHTQRGSAVRIISLRRASADEREAYRVWIENECHAS